ncbi:major royal jelly protein-domain-containing protein [Trametes polyzona]|nr:major royal jelly protein-domain-containing protein [Trametes polyzona]
MRYRLTFASVLVSAISLVGAATATQNSGVFNFPDYPPPGTPPPNQTLADSVARLPPSEAGRDPALRRAKIHIDTGKYGPEIELVHAYYNFWPTGVGVSSNGRIFTCYPRGNETFTLGEVNSPTTEAPFPNQDANTPPAFANASNPGFSVATDKLLFVQSVVVDGKDRVWALDTGRPRVNGTVINAAAPGGPKLVGFDLNGKRFTTITFPASVVAADSSLNDVRFDLRGEGFAYITDSSPNRAGIVVVNLSNGESWRHLDGHPSVSAQSGFIPFHNGVPTYLHPPTEPNAVEFFTRFAVDGIALSADGEFLYYTPLAGRHLFRVPTSVLKVRPSATNPNAIILANQAVQDLGETGSHADGLETDDQGFIYLGAPEHNAINRFNPKTGMIEPFIRDPAIQWPDTLSVVSLKSRRNFLYFTANQLWLGPDYQNGTDLRTKPYAIFRVPIEGGKATQTT